MSLEPKHYQDAVIAIAHEAGRRIMAIFTTDFPVASKDDQSPLTQADLAAHDCIVAGLKRFEDVYPILSEESTLLPYETRRQWDTYWLIDPLDGTKEFINKRPEFTVNIALIHEGYPILGVVHVPAQGCTYVASASEGAFRLSDFGRRDVIHVAPLHHQPLKVVGSRSHGTPALSAYLNALGPHDLVSIGSSLKFCLVAEGQADIYPRIGPTSEWDTAAAQCVVEEAGGHVVDMEGNRLAYNRKDSLRNPNFLVYGDTNFDWLRPSSS